jgi:hypothetical protein
MIDRMLGQADFIIGMTAGIVMAQGWYVTSLALTMALTVFKHVLIAYRSEHAPRIPA